MLGAAAYLASQPCARRGRWLTHRVAALCSAQLPAPVSRRSLVLGAAAGSCIAPQPRARRSGRPLQRPQPSHRPALPKAVRKLYRLGAQLSKALQARGAARALQARGAARPPPKRAPHSVSAPPIRTSTTAFSPWRTEPTLETSQALNRAGLATALHADPTHLSMICPLSRPFSTASRDSADPSKAPPSEPAPLPPPTPPAYQMR